MLVAAKLLAFSGSARSGSLNKILANAATEAARAAGAKVTLIDLRDFAMPVYDGDLEAKEGIPSKARELKALFMAHNGLLIASPENNASISSMLKNTLDWVSRPDSGQNGLVPYQNKVAGLLSASPGALGGLRGLVHLRAILQTLNVQVISEQFALGRAHEAFDESGKLKDARQQAMLSGTMQRLVDVTARLST